uniref:DDE Tnp4 domain-containing protein n=1 Tax=Lactuca sativa TaxID=4236 RepID=A0A9R1XPL9_LACSA|nr:hypothetical protein LSAT_V11C300148690 [Lactuca sativa]
MWYGLTAGFLCLIQKCSLRARESGGEFFALCNVDIGLLVRAGCLDSSKHGKLEDAFGQSGISLANPSPQRGNPNNNIYNRKTLTTIAPNPYARKSTIKEHVLRPSEGYSGGYANLLVVVCGDNVTLISKMAIRYQAKKAMCVAYVVALATREHRPNGGSDEDDLVLHTLLFAAHNRVQQRGESTNIEKRRRISIVRDRIAAHKLLSFMVTYICGIQLEMILNNCMPHMKLNMAYQECLATLIVHIGSGQIVPMHGESKAPNMSFVVNEHQYNYGYYLGDGIYPEYATFFKSFSFPADEKRQLFKLAQESVRKDVERAFGVLKQKRHIIKHPARSWDRAKLTKVLTACVILHNMIIEEEGRAICMYNPEDILNSPAVLNYYVF